MLHFKKTSLFWVITFATLCSDCRPRVRDESGTKNAANSGRGDVFRYHGESYFLQDGALVAVESNNQEPTGDLSAQTGLALDQPDTPYMAQCRKAGVPLPPPWGSAGWHKVGELSPQLIFAKEKGRTELWTAETGEGVCAAIPRATKGTAIDVFGVICTSKQGNTCFWDNIYSGIDKKIAPINAGFDIKYFGRGADRLDEYCTDCHRGTTPWIRVAGQPTINLKQLSSTWRPIAPDGWKSPDGPVIQGCSKCHAMPQLNKSYCAVVKNMVATNVMPPKTVGGAERAAMVTAFNNACAAVR